MVFELSEITSDSEFADLATLLYDSFHEPYNPFFQLLNSTVGSREEQIRAKELRHAASWRSNPEQHWIKITDSAADSRLVAAASWFVHETAPTKADEPVVASWHRDGSTIRSFTSEWLSQLKKVSRERMMRPHLGQSTPRLLLLNSWKKNDAESPPKEIDQLATHPSYRRKGAAKMLIEWGIQLADNLCIEVSVLAVPFGVPLYKSMGFVQLEKIDPEVPESNPSDEWKKLQMLDKHLFWMWRSVKGQPHVSLS